jgi:hypothetical protein
MTECEREGEERWELSPWKTNWPGSGEPDLEREEEFESAQLEYEVEAASWPAALELGIAALSWLAAGKEQEAAAASCESGLGERGPGEPEGKLSDDAGKEGDGDAEKEGDGDRDADSVSAVKEGAGWLGEFKFAVSTASEAAGKGVSVESAVTESESSGAEWKALRSSSHSTSAQVKARPEASPELVSKSHSRHMLVEWWT